MWPSARFSKMVFVLQRNPAFSPTNWLGQRSEWQWLWEEWISCFRIYNSVVSWVCALQWACEAAQAVQNTTLPTFTTEPWLWRSAGSTIPWDPDAQTAPQLQALCVCSGMVHGGQVERKAKTCEMFSCEDGVIDQRRQYSSSLASSERWNEVPSHHLLPSDCWNTNACGVFFCQAPKNGFILQVSWTHTTVVYEKTHSSLLTMTFASVNSLYLQIIHS